jgi:hypothetical protein
MIKRTFEERVRSWFSYFVRTFRQRDVTPNSWLIVYHATRGEDIYAGMLEASSRSFASTERTTGVWDAVV